MIAKEVHCKSNVSTRENTREEREREKKKIVHNATTRTDPVNILDIGRDIGHWGAVGAKPRLNTNCSREVLVDGRELLIHLSAQLLQQDQVVGSILGRVVVADGTSLARVLPVVRVRCF